MKHLLLATLFGVCLGVSSGVVAVPVSDLKSIALSAKEQADALQRQIISTQKQITGESMEESEHGNATCSASPENSKKKKQYITTEVFEYLYEEVLDAGNDDADDIIKPSTSYAENRTNVKETFFAPYEEDSGLTELGEDINDITSELGYNFSQKGYSASEVLEIREKREEYASYVAAKNLKIAVDLREKIMNDLKSTQNVQTSGCNKLHGYLYENRNQAALIKETASDIIVQILTLESMGAKLLLKDDPGVLSVPTKPAEEK